jgi:hypothetical protein
VVWRKAARHGAWSNLVWNWKKLGISTSGREAAQNLEMAPSDMFAHPDIISEHPEMAEYYRLMAFLPKKGLPKITARTGTKEKAAFCSLVNRSLSRLVVAAANASREGRLNPILAGAAKQQGSWVDPGLQAARDFERILLSYANEKGLLDWEATARLAATRLKTEQDIGQVLDLLDVLKDEEKQAACLEELFKFRLREKI